MNLRPRPAAPKLFKVSLREAIPDDQDAQRPLDEKLDFYTYEDHGLPPLLRVALNNATAMPLDSIAA